MSFERILQVGVAALVALSTALLAGLGEQHIGLPLAAVIIAFAAVYVTDVRGWIRLNTRAADVLGLAAVLMAVVQWQQDTSDAGLLALLNFVIYGQFVLQFKKKGVGTYWLLIALSFMEAAVATALSESLMFGILLIGYVFAAIAVMTVFYLYREQVRAQHVLSPPQRTTPLLAASRPGAVALSHASQEMVFSGHANPQQIDAAVNAALWRFVANLGGMTLCTASLLFAVIPRSERGTWRQSGDEPVKRVVGFASEVQLGELGSISESDEEVMQAWLVDPSTRNHIELADEPLFRGVVLTNYANRRWRRAEATRSHIQPTPTPPGATVVTQRFVVRPIDTNVLFAMQPAYSRASNADVMTTADGDQLTRPRRLMGDTIEYELLTTAIADRRMRRIVPARIPLDDLQRERLLDIPTAPDGSDPFEGTRALAAQILRDVPADDPVERAWALANYLRDPTNFRYSLRGVQRDPALDPIEDFVTKNRVGHCEYFASALAMMLRSVGIPARLAIGFKGGEYTGSYYEIRAMDAHAWVEAYLEPAQVPALPTADIDASQGAWLIVDPTGAGGDTAALGRSNFLMAGMMDFFSSLRNTWRFYIAGLNYERQQEFIYEPIRRAAVSSATELTNRDFWQAFGETLINWVSPAYWGLTNGGWFSWRGALAAIVIMLTLSCAYYAGQWLLRRLMRLTLHSASRAQRGARDVEFYRRLENLLAAYDLIRGASQTQREFAVAVGGQLAESVQTKHAAPLARHLVETFYRVRFGARPLDATEVATVEQALADLAGALALGNGRRVRDVR